MAPRKEFPLNRWHPEKTFLKKMARGKRVCTEQMAPRKEFPLNRWHPEKTFLKEMAHRKRVCTEQMAPRKEFPLIRWDLFEQQKRRLSIDTWFSLQIAQYDKVNVRL
jgi:hypothetical protein